jgi:hypothetical protein
MRGQEENPLRKKAAASIEGTAEQSYNGRLVIAEKDQQAN